MHNVGRLVKDYRYSVLITGWHKEKWDTDDFDSNEFPIK